MSVRVRFAPSPTGKLHIGALRDALFKDLFARHTAGKNIFRIEDTDRTRYDANSEQEFIDTLRWVGIEFDEGPHIGGKFSPYRQSERKEIGIYAHWIQELLNLGGAYYAFETPEELQEMREFQQINKMPTGYFGGKWRDASADAVKEALDSGMPSVIRLKVRRGRKIQIQDAIRGLIEWDSDTIDDPVLIKADGMPTYHFAAMVDDHLMEITHIIRGEEWISSAPKHAELFDLFGWERPVFVHCPVIVGADGKKLSKRHGAVRVLDYASEGYLKDSLKNFIALIGWSPGEDKEVFTMDELVEKFDLDGLQPSPGRFDLSKLKWMNGIAIRSMSPAEVLAELKTYLAYPFVQEYWREYVHDPENPESSLENGPRVLETLTKLIEASESDPDLALAAIALEQERVQKLSEFGEACSFFVEEPPHFDEKAVAKWLTQEHVPTMFARLAEEIEAQSAASAEDFESILKAYQVEAGLEKLGPVVHPVRVAMTGRTFGPGLFELMAVLGSKRVVARLKGAPRP